MTGDQVPGQAPGASSCPQCGARGAGGDSGSACRHQLCVVGGGVGGAGWD